MKYCCLCKKKQHAGSGTFFSVPKDEYKRNKWKRICRMEFTANALICMDHFHPSSVIKAARKMLLMPNAVPVMPGSKVVHKDNEPQNAAPMKNTPWNQLVSMELKTEVGPRMTHNLLISDAPVKSINFFCALGCPPGNKLFKFPSRSNDEKRRKYWLNFFGMLDPNIDEVYACERHFSSKQTLEKGIRLDAFPDKHPESISPTCVYVRKFKPKAPALEDPLKIDNNVQTLQLQEQSILQIPLIQPVQCSKSAQTNTRLCGLVEVSDFGDEYRLNCFYCCEVFPLVKWKRFLSHLKRRHKYEEAFKINKYVSDDHDYTAINLEESLIEKENSPLVQQPSFATVVIEPSALLPLLVKPPEISFETVNLSPNFYKTEQENIEYSDRLLMPAPETSLNLASSSSTKKGKSKQNKKKSAISSTKSKTKIISSGVLYLNNKKQNSNITPLSRCLKRSNTIESLASQDERKEDTELNPPVVESFEPKPTELVFEYAPKDIMNLLLDSMKDYPVLWEFDDQPFNEDYYEAVEDICKIINNKWSLNIDNLKMRRSINRILRFYCSLYPLENVENINEYTCYYDKCASFLPESVHDIAYARCSHCYKCFENDFDLKAHLLDEQNRNLGWPYKCVQCKECYNDNDDYEFHKRLKHYEEIFRCKQCPRKFTRRNIYNHHVSLHKWQQSNMPGKHVCDICGKDFPTSSGLRGHRKYHGEKKHKCHLCPKSFYGNSLLLRHLKSHRNEYDLICEVCGKGFLFHNNLREHMKKHTGAKVTCNICNLKLRKSSLNRHLRTVHIACEGTIETTHRARNFFYKRLLRPRQTPYKRASYRKEKNYQCKICNIHFDGYKSRVEHNKEFHSDGPRYPCQLCTSEFGLKINLKSHYRRKHSLHVYQVFKLVDRNEDLDTVLAIKQDELDRLAETADYSLTTPAKSTNDNQKTLIIKEDPSRDEMSFEEERMHSDTIQDEIMKATDNIVATDDIKIDDDHYMNDLLKMF